MDDPTPWLMRQEGDAAVRARRSLGLAREGDEPLALRLRRDLDASQLPDGSFGGSLMKTAGVLNLLDDLRVAGRGATVSRAVGYLISVLEGQPGYRQAGGVRPGSLRNPCDLCGFFGPYADRGLPRVMARGAAEMNAYREFEPLLGPRTSVRDVRRSALDRAGPGSCYSWGFIPLAYTVEAICRAGHSDEPRLAPAINVLLGAQRAGGGWCRNLGGHPGCTIHALRALAGHPKLRRSVYAERGLTFMAGSWKRAGLFPALQAVSRFDSPATSAVLTNMLASAAARQRKNGSFGTPYPVERVAAVLMASRCVQGAREHAVGTSRPHRDREAR